MCILQWDLRYLRSTAGGGQFSVVDDGWKWKASRLNNQGEGGGPVRAVENRRSHNMMKHEGGPSTNLKDSTTAPATPTTRPATVIRVVCSMQARKMRLFEKKTISGAFCPSPITMHSNSRGKGFGETAARERHRDRSQKRQEPDLSAYAAPRPPAGRRSTTQARARCMCKKQRTDTSRFLMSEIYLRFSSIRLFFATCRQG